FGARTWQTIHQSAAGRIATASTRRKIMNSNTARKNGREQGTHQGGRAESRPHGRRCEAASGPVAPALGQRRPARAPQTRRTADALSLWLSRSLPLSSGALQSCTDFGRGRTLMAKFVTITDDTGSQIVINV